MATDAEEAAHKLLTAVSHALNLFGGDVEPTPPTPVGADRALEDHLGLGYV